MLAALLATRSSKPLPFQQTYGNQLVAATTTFPCIALVQSAGMISTSPSIAQSLLLSVPGQEAVIDTLDRLYNQLINQYSSTIPSYLSTTITNVIVLLDRTYGIFKTLPTTSANAGVLISLQQQLATAIAILYSLAIPVNRLQPPTN